MPELPEVETVKRALSVTTWHKTIDSVDVYYAKIIANMTEDEFKSSLKGQEVIDLKRRGKFIIFVLTDYYLISHLRMEGCYYLKQNDSLHEPVNKHEHIIFNLNDGHRLVYRDVRKFGRMWLLPKDCDIESCYPLNKCGYEPLGDIDVNDVYLKYHKSHLTMKELLLDQSIICGIGNIYDAEILYDTHINPLLKGCDISRSQVALIIQSTRRILQKAIDAGGSTIKSFMSPLEVHGAFQNDFKAYHCDRCSICGSPLERVKIGERSSFFCPKCQPLNKIHVVGITGSIACGKSMVSDYLKSKKYPLIDCDTLAKEVYTVYNETISEAFKDCDVFTNQVLDRAKLAQRVFNDQAIQKRLEALIHPLVISMMLDQIGLYSKDYNLIFVDIPLLYEAGCEHLVDSVWVVSTNQDIQIKRLMERDHISRSYALEKINSQMSLSEKEQRADYVLHNNGDLEDLYQQIDKLI